MTGNKDLENRLKARPFPKVSVLQGHKREKNTLVPPILGIPNTRLISTIDTIVPEIIWVGIVLEYFGLREGIEHTTKFLGELWQQDYSMNWYRFSQVAGNPKLVVAACDQKVLENVEIGFSTMRSVYGCTGLDWTSLKEDEGGAMARMVRAIEKYSDRHEKPYLTALSTVVYAMAVAGKVKFSADTAPDIESIVSDWGSDDADAAAATLRAMSLAFFPQDSSDESDDWCKTFWRKNYQISECK